MAVDRSKYQAVPLATVQAAKLKDDAEAGTGDRIPFDKIKENGKHRYRLLPTLEPEHGLFYQRAVHWLSGLDEDDETKRTTVLNGRIHGNLNLDPIEAYITFVTSRLQNSKKKTDEAKIKALTDYRTGLGKDVTYLAYALKITGKEADNTLSREMVIWEMKPSVRKKLDLLALNADEEDTEGMEPFSHPDSGRNVTVTFNKEETPSNMYSVTLATKANPLTDEELEAYELKAKPLSEMLNGVYTRKHYDKAVQGLQHFDIQHNINLFNDPEFQDTLSKISAEVSDDVDDENEGPDLDSMTRSELKAFIAEKSLPISVTKSKTDEAIRAEIRQQLELEDEPEDEDEDEDEEEDTPPPPPARKKAAKAPAKAAAKPAPVEDDDDDASSDDDEDAGDDDDDTEDRAKSEAVRGNLRSRLAATKKK